jgi:uncharacterized protein (DUF302 family)
MNSKNLILITAICFGLTSLTNQNSFAQTAMKDSKKQSKITQMNEEILLENESKYNFAETVERLTIESEKKKWTVSAVHDLQATLKKHGSDVLPIKVFALCHPSISSKILLNDDERIVSSLMPCRVSVYEKSDGKTYISRMNSGFLAASMGGIVEDAMIEATKEIEEILRGLVI